MFFHEADRIFNSTRITAKGERKNNKIKQNYRFLSSMCCYCCRLKGIRTAYAHTHNIDIELIIAAEVRDRIKKCMRSNTTDHNQTYMRTVPWINMHRMLGSQKATQKNNYNTKIYAIIWR